MPNFRSWPIAVIVERLPPSVRCRMTRLHKSTLCYTAVPRDRSGINCPEKCQAYGQKAKQAASALVFDKEVTVQTHGKDKYKRTIGDVILSDGINLNQELVKQGWC